MTVLKTWLGDFVPHDLKHPCWSKTQHDTKEAADAHAASLLRAGLATDPATLTSYECIHCGKWHIGHDRLKERPMSDVREAIRKGGVVTVFLGRGYDIHNSLRLKPQMRAVMANNMTRARIADNLANARAAILTTNIDHGIYASIHNELKRRHLVYQIRKTQKELDSTLAEIFEEPEAEPETTGPVNGNVAVANETTATTRSIAPRGSVGALIEEFWPELEKFEYASQAARWLWKVVEERKMLTTQASLEQGIRLRRKRTPGTLAEAEARRVAAAEASGAATPPEATTYLPPLPETLPSPPVTAGEGASGWELTPEPTPTSTIPPTPTIEPPRATPRAGLVAALSDVIDTLILLRDDIEAREQAAAQQAELERENNELKAKLALLREAFQQL